MFARATTAALCLAFAATPAAAGDDNSLFTGLYAGGGASYEDFSAKPTSLGINLASFDDQEISYGGFVGWRAGVGHRWVMGVEAFAGTSGPTVDLVFLNVTPFMDPDRSFGLGLTVGRVFGEGILIYASGAGISTKFKNRQLGLTLETREVQGWRAGGGIELALTDNFGVRASATYTNYSNFDFEVFDPFLGPVTLTQRPAALNYSGAVVIGF